MTRLAPLLPLLGLALGCASARPPIDPLRVTATALSLAGIAITEASNVHNATIRTAYQGRLAACPPPPEREACAARAQAEVRAATAPRTEVLTRAAQIQNKAADAAALAEACRKAGQDCEEARAREAKALLDELGALLATTPLKGTP
jgi:hypothetical protein